MTRAPHPTFGNWFRRFFIRAWLVSAGLFVVSLVLVKNGCAALGSPLAVAFGISVPFTIGYLLYRLYHVDCPRCHARLKTVKNRGMCRYEAVCGRCNIAWELGVAIGYGD
jgi:hypothetical protein